MRSTCAGGSVVPLIHILCKSERVVRTDEEIGGGSTWTIGVAHRDSLFSANGKHRHARDEPAKQANAKFESYMVKEGDGRAMHVCTRTNHIPTAC